MFCDFSQGQPSQNFTILGTFGIWVEERTSTTGRIKMFKARFQAWRAVVQRQHNSSGKTVRGQSKH